METKSSKKTYGMRPSNGFQQTTTKITTLTLPNNMLVGV
jgi:hypothetical protein